MPPYSRVKKVVRVGSVAWLLILWLSVASQASSPPPPAPVTLGDDTLFNIQAGVASFSPQFRAQVISQRINSLANNYDLNLNTLKVVDHQDYSTTDIQAGDQVLMTIAGVDAAAAGVPRDQLARQYLRIIRQAVSEFRAAHSLPNILRGLLLTLLLTAILIASQVTITRSVPLVYSQLHRWQDTRIPALRILGVRILSARRVVDLICEVIKLLQLALSLGLIYLYANLVLSLFPWTEGLSRTLFNYVLTAIDTLGSGVISYLPNLFYLALISFATSYLLKIFRFIFTEIRHGHTSFSWFDPDWAQPTYKLVQFVVLALALTVAFPYLPGAGTPAFQGVSVFLGVLLSLGSSSAIANVVAGVILTYTRGFKVGDRVQITDTTGDVTEKTLFVTRLRTIKNVVITIPNSAVLSSHIINYSAAANNPTAPPLILHTTITLGYDIPWRQVHKALIEAALATPEVLEQPPPFVLQTSLDDFYVSYQLNAYTHRPTRMAQIYSDLHQNIQDKCNEAQIEILSPHYRSVRDGNETSIPADYLPKDYQAPPFRVVTRPYPQEPKASGP